MEVIEEPSEQVPTLGAKRAIGLFVLFVVLQFLFGFLFSLFLGIYVGVVVELGYMESSVAPEFVSLFELPIGVLSLTISAAIIFRMTRRTLPGAVGQGAFESLGWRNSQISSVLLACFIGALIAAGFIFIIAPAVPPIEGQSWGPLAKAAALGGWQRFYWSVLVLLLAPPIEEFVFRGVLFTGLFNAFGTYFSAMVVTFLFVVMHFGEALHYWPVWIMVSLLAVATVVFRVKTKSLLPAIAAHFSYNLVLVVAVYVGGT